MKCNLYDILQDRFRSTAPTHQKGSRLDTIMGTQFIRDNTTGIGQYNSGYGAVTNHALYFIDLNEKIFTKKTNPTRPSLCSITSK